MADVLKRRLEKLACHFPLKDNYFAWQAFARRYPDPQEGALPVYLQAQHYPDIRAGAERVHVHHTGYTDFLRGKPAESIDRFILLDAQDWMTDTQLNDLWSQISRTAARNARVIFRTAAEPSVLPGRVDDAVLGQWTYHREQSAALCKRDRSAIYGGFHLYEKA
jgi:S-adenosylmethionine-diacylglycerol 3-amino-3-carboxypropyl transferase